MKWKLFKILFGLCLWIIGSILILIKEPSVMFGVFLLIWANNIE